MRKQTRKRKQEKDSSTSCEPQYMNKALKTEEMSLVDALNMCLREGFMQHLDEEPDDAPFNPGDLGGVPYNEDEDEDERPFYQAVPLDSDSDSGVGEDDDSDDEMSTGSIAKGRDDDGVDIDSTEPDKQHDIDYSFKDHMTGLCDTPHPRKLQSDIDKFKAYRLRETLPHGSLLQKILEYKKMADLNCDVYNEGPHINSVEFHPSSLVALVAGSSGIANFYSVDGIQNKVFHSVTQEDFPVQCAKFIMNGSRAILGSKFSHIFSVDLESAKVMKIKLPPALNEFDNFIPCPDKKSLAVVGRSGEIHILSAESLELLYTLKQNCDVSALSFNLAGDLLFSHSTAGTVTIWDTKMQRIKHVFADENSLHGTAINVSPCNQLVATGSVQGFVNLYKMDNVIYNEIPKPLKTIHTMTSINNLKFNHSSEILALSSANILNSVKLYSLKSEHIFSNFQSIEEKLGYVNVMNFSPNSGYIAFGSQKAVVTLYRLKHYQSY